MLLSSPLVNAPNLLQMIAPQRNTTNMAKTVQSKKLSIKLL